MRRVATRFDKLPAASGGGPCASGELTHSIWHSPDGERVTIRPICSGDARITREFVRELSPETRYSRFMRALRELTPQELERLVHIDHAREIALVAVTSAGGRQRQVGESRYALCPGSDSCEFAIAVLDAWQRRGLGERLLAQLVDVARIRGLRAMIGDVLATNAAMLGLAFKLGFDVSRADEGWTIRRACFALAPDSPTTRRASQRRRAVTTLSGSKELVQ